MWKITAILENKGNINTLPHEYLFWNYGGISAIRHGDLKLVNLPDKFPELYNLSVDVSEQNDIAEERKKTGIKLIEKLGMWNMTCPEPLFFQGNGQKIGFRRLYDKISLLQPVPAKN